MTDVRWPIAAGAALLWGPWMLWRGFRTMRTLRLIENTPTARIRSMAMGLVEVQGRVRGRSSLTAPFTGRPCAFWQVDVAVRGRRRGGWTVIHRDQSGNPFFLEDDTGVAMVYPAGARCRMHHSAEEECAGLLLPEPYASYVARRASMKLALARVSTLRFREQVLEEGQSIYVLGTAVPRSRAFVVSEGEGLAPGSGETAERGGRDLDREVVAVVRRGDNEETFLISQEQERDLAMALRWRTAAMLLGGPLLALFGLGYWLMAFARGRPV